MYSSPFVGICKIFTSVADNTSILRVSSGYSSMYSECPFAHRILQLLGLTPRKSYETKLLRNLQVFGRCWDESGRRFGG